MRHHDCTGLSQQQAVTKLLVRPQGACKHLDPDSSPQKLWLCHENRNANVKFNGIIARRTSGQAVSPRSRKHSHGSHISTHYSEHRQPGAPHTHAVWASPRTGRLRVTHPTMRKPWYRGTDAK